MGKSPIVCKDDLTRQADKQACDINFIVERWKKTGTLPLNHLMRQPLYGDFSKPVKFAEALNLVNVANTQFAKLPVEIRKLFHYDVELFLEFVNDPKNNEKMYELGIKDRPNVVKDENNVQSKTKVSKADTDVVSAATKKEG